MHICKHYTYISALATHRAVGEMHGGGVGAVHMYKAVRVICDALLKKCLSVDVVCDIWTWHTVFYCRLELEWRSIPDAGQDIRNNKFSFKFFQLGFFYTQFYVFPIFSFCNSNFFTRITKPHILHFIDSYLRVYVVALIHFMSRS